MDTESQWSRINAYVRSRMRERKDVYGWSQLAAHGRPRALLLIANDADPRSFPHRISDVEIELRPVEPPEAQRE